MNAAPPSNSAAAARRPAARLWVVLALAAGVLLGFMAGWYAGAVDQSSSAAVREATMCYVALTDSTTTLQPQTREYLKGRLYWNAAVEIRPGYLDGWRIDFGPVDTTALMGLGYIKDAATDDDIYQAALRRQPRSALKP